MIVLCALWDRLQHHMTLICKKCVWMDLTCFSCFLCICFGLHFAQRLRQLSCLTHPPSLKSNYVTNSDVGDE